MLEAKVHYNANGNDEIAILWLCENVLLSTVEKTEYIEYKWTI